MTEFDGSNYVPSRDKKRLRSQQLKIIQLMKDQKWRTLDQISEKTGGLPQASVSAQLRHLRKIKFGAHTVEKRHLGEGLWFYRLILRKRK